MPYTLRFSDATKTQEVIVPDMPPGINTVDTSLSLVGKNYPNYGEKIASNFLHLLENFASPTPPENPIEGQLWYDTRDPTNKVLRIMDGTATSARWPAVNRIYQQPEDPRNSISSGLRNGDIWVDTANNQLKIYSTGQWTLVGPMVTNGGLRTGPEPTLIDDTSSPANSYPVILNYVNGVVVSIISSHNEFTPRSVIDGFTSIKPGINLAILNNSRALLNGISDSALKLEVDNLSYTGDKFLRKDDQTSNGQVITGRILFRTPANQSGAQGRDGVVIITSSEDDSTNYIQFYKNGNNAVLLNNKAAGKIIFQTKPSSNSGLFDTLTIEHNAVGINTTTNALSPALDINGSARINQTLELTSISTTSLKLSGGAIIQKSLRVLENINVSGSVTVNNTMTVGITNGSGVAVIPAVNDTYDLGSPTKYFRNIYVSNILGASTFITGMIVPFGSSTVVPSSWLACDGSSYSTSVYPNLFSIIGYTYGGSSGTFNVPNFVSTDAGNNDINYIIKT